jgi:ABC-2 type transport system ATP-binding protein
MQRRLSLASTLVHGPQLLFLDEPTAGIDPVLRRKFWDYFEELKEAGTTLVITTQYVSESAYCDRVGVMAEGRLLFVDTPEGLRKRAYGGEIVDLRTTDRITYEHVQSLIRLPYVRASVDRVSANEARILVDEASTAMPALVDWSKENNLTIESIQEYIPPFDDVFVKLIQRYENNA